MEGVGPLLFWDNNATAALPNKVYVAFLFFLHVTWTVMRLIISCVIPFHIFINKPSVTQN